MFFGIEDFDVKNKRVLVRVDFNVPVNDNGLVIDDSRIKEALPTIEYLVKKKAVIILMSHLGRPDGKVVDKLRLNKVAERLSELLRKEVKKVDDCVGDSVVKAVNNLKPGEIILLENLRFHSEEEKDDEDFAKKLSSFADFFVNDAFGACHRAHASVHAITEFLPSCAGFLLEKELTNLTPLLEAPKRPFVVVLGGVKVSDKIGVITKFVESADKVLVGGAMSNTFLKAKGINVGLSKVEGSQLDFAKKFVDNKKVVLPVDCVIADRFEEDASSDVVDIKDIEDDWLALDIGPETIKNFKAVIKDAKTVFWNGPMGVFEWKKFSSGTSEIAKAIAKSKAVKVGGGGETVEALNKFKLAKKMTHVSTGGGASLEFLEGKKLPAVTALESSYEKFKNNIKNVTTIK